MVLSEVKRSSLKEEEEEEEVKAEADDAVASSGQTVAVWLHSHVARDEPSSVSALRDGGVLSTFGKAIPRGVSPKQQEFVGSSDYDNTTMFNCSNDIEHLPGAENALQSDVIRRFEGEFSVVADMNAPHSAPAIPTDADSFHSPVQTPKSSDEADMADLDSAIALMKSMASSDDVVSTPVSRLGMFEHRPHEDQRRRRPDTASSSSSSEPPSHLISTEKTTSILSNSASLHSQSNHFVTVDEMLHSATPVRLNSPSEMRSQGAASAGTSGCSYPETDASLTPVSVATTQAAMQTRYGKRNNTVGPDHYYSIHEITKYGDPNSLYKSPAKSPSSEVSSVISILTETDNSSATAQETTARTSDNRTGFENAAEDLISVPGKRRSCQRNCFTPDMEECPTLTSSGYNVVSDSSSNVTLSGDVAGIPIPVDQFKALRLEVLRATSKLLDFVGEIWRRQESLHGRISKINQLCLHLKTGLQELENFGLGLVSHLSEEERQTSEKKLFSQMKLLQNIRNGINRYLESLEMEALGKHLESSEKLRDESLKVKVGNIILLTKVIPGLVRTFGSFVDDIVKVDFSSRPIVISEADSNLPKALSSGNHPTGDSRTIISPDFVTQHDRDLTSEREETPPAIPPKLSHSAAKTMSDSKMIQEDKSNSGEDYVRTALCYGNPSENTVLATVNQGSNDSTYTVRLQVSGQLNSSVAGEPPALPSKGAYRPCYDVATDPLDARDSTSSCLQSVVFRRKRPTSPAALHSTATDPNNVVDGMENRFSASELVTPDIRASGISLTVQTKLEELQRQATSHNVLLHTDADCSFMDYDLPAGIMEENLPNLCESDCKLLLYYSDEMFNHWKVLDSAASAFFQCMELSQPPKIFLMHSRFVIVAGHKMAYIGDVLARNVADDEARDWLLAYSNDLCDRLKHAVRTTKGAALAFPAVKPLQLMVDAIKEVTDSAYELRELLFRLAYIGRAEQSFSL